MKGIDLLQKLQSVLPRISLLTVCKSFIRPHLDYGDVVYDQPSNDAFLKKTQNCPEQCSFSNNGSNKRYISQKIVSRFKVRISSTNKMYGTPLSILQSCFN